MTKPIDSAILNRIGLIVLDVDGVLTDGTVRLLPDGGEVKVFSVRDGLAIRWALQAGIGVAFLSGRQSAAVERRAAELGVTQVIQGSRDKVADFEILAKDSGDRFEDTAFMGDDVPDLPLLDRVGLSAAPADAAPELLTEVDYVCRAEGGRGAVRELIELVLRSRGVWQAQAAGLRD